MTCVKCKIELRDGAIYCDACGKKQATTKRKRTKRPNGQGSVFQDPATKKWTAQRIFGYEALDNGKLRAIVAKKTGLLSETDALNYLPKLMRTPKKISLNITFKGIYDLWLPEWQRRGRTKSTEDCYKAAIKHFRDIWFLRFADVGIDDLQECVDDCEKGKQTRKNMKTLAGMMWDYAIPRGYTEGASYNPARTIFVSGERSVPRAFFTKEQREVIRKNIGKVPYADYIYCDCYLGFRPHELLTLDAANYNHESQCFIGGSKTEAGIDRLVTISPKIQETVKRIIGTRTKGPIFCAPDGKTFDDKDFREECFYPALEEMGIDNPIDPKTGRHKYSPHCCRHTFATMMKDVQAPDKDKLSLIGHASTEMLRHYQHTNLNDLKNITDMLD